MMKKHITLAIFFIFFASAATIFAQAQQSNANMNQMKMQQTNSTMNQDMSCCKKMMGNKMMMFNPLTDAQAKQLVTDYIKNNNLKGY
jgi:cytochrome c1